MTAFTRTLVALGTLLVLSGCATDRAKSLRMLDDRAEYGNPAGPLDAPGLKEAGLDQFRNSPIPVRTRPRIAAIWIHRHETPSRDYFWGGWISVVIEQDQWVLTKPGALPPAPGIMPNPGITPKALLKTKALSKPTPEPKTLQ